MCRLCSVSKRRMWKSWTMAWARIRLLNRVALPATRSPTTAWMEALATLNIHKQRSPQPPPQPQPPPLKIQPPRKRAQQPAPPAPQLPQLPQLQLLRRPPGTLGFLSQSADVSRNLMATDARFQCPPLLRQSPVLNQLLLVGIIYARSMLIETWIFAKMVANVCLYLTAKSPACKNSPAISFYHLN